LTIDDPIKITDGVSIWRHGTGNLVLEFEELQDDGSTCSHDIWLDAEAIERLREIIGATI
jgi:hypothetical protein